MALWNRLMPRDKNLICPTINFGPNGTHCWLLLNGLPSCWYPRGCKQFWTWPQSLYHSMILSASESNIPSQEGHCLFSGPAWSFSTFGLLYISRAKNDWLKYPFLPKSFYFWWAQLTLVSLFGLYISKFMFSSYYFCLCGFCFLTISGTFYLPLVT